MNLRDHRRTFSYSGRDPLIGTAAHVANGEHAFDVGLQWANRLIVMRYIASRQNETVVVQLHIRALESRSIWVGPNEQKKMLHGHCPFNATNTSIAYGFQMVISFEGDEFPARVQSEVRQRSDTLDQVPRHAVIQALRA
ncbi:hypothetical protein [Cupriavidus pauculus]|uniref:Uncharacterized protein n=1 Tax=Cupriavidus pauculus TaxID=82633 RepID=A0A3G8HAJ0_9BURK|nr:hypothetical protein [Cupriavidus pauculus]AZG17285.1 hypothetical protein EHF44_27970 [Cupriavidus pauculus]